MVAIFSHNTTTSGNFKPGGERVGCGFVGTSELNSVSTSELNSVATGLSASVCVRVYIYIVYILYTHYIYIYIGIVAL
jgi:hypothetical protein